MRLHRLMVLTASSWAAFDKPPRPHVALPDDAGRHQPSPGLAALGIDVQVGESPVAGVLGEAGLEINLKPQFVPDLVRASRELRATAASGLPQRTREATHAPEPVGEEADHRRPRASLHRRHPTRRQRERDRQTTAAAADLDSSSAPRFGSPRWSQSAGYPARFDATEDGELTASRGVAGSLCGLFRLRVLRPGRGDRWCP
jgi:hypothetical protein